ncbi:MAG: DapH/DapD/GlmU-related protein [Kineosporiaceae bacterium]
MLIANGVAIVGRSDHALDEPGVPIRHARWVGDDPETLSRPVAIGSDVWIGFGAIVLSGVRLGDSSVVGAGAVVTRDVAQNTVVAGNPAVPVRTRFPTEAFEEHWRRLTERGIRRHPTPAAPPLAS